tara:strand:- start:309 stop:506 length:198 start_codon:yes stop_codon:yes gene_type:complete
MDIKVHKVTKIEVKKRRDISNFSVREIVFHNLEYDYEKGSYFPTKTEITCFLEDKDVAKLIYSKE